MTAPRFDVTLRRNVEHVTADGVTLRADVYSPDGPGPFPVLVCRTPYDKAAPLNADFARALAARGYVAVAQDIRGSHASGGTMIWQFAPEAFAVEAADGHDTIEWAARLPGSDGRVGTFGVSYSSWLSLCLLARRPPSLKAMSVSGMVAGIRDMNFGIFETGRRLQWTYAQAAGHRHRLGDPKGPQSLAEANAEWLQTLRQKWIWRLPLASIPDYVFDPLTDALRRYYPMQADEIWPFRDHHSAADFPVCIQTGWWDRFSLSVDHFTGLRDRAPAAHRNRHRLLIGPWPHSPFTLNGRIGPVDYGPAADTTYPDIVGDWYDFHFLGRETDLACGDPVRLFILNENGWRGYPDWPPPGMRPTDFFLRSGGDANTVRGNGALSFEPPAEEAPDRYLYDPADPVMSLMGADSQFSPVDQRPNNDRPDILVYQTGPIENDLLLIGPLTLELWAASDAPETDFTAKLIEVRPDGLAIQISQGILRTSCRDGYDAPAPPLRPDEPTRLRITMLPVGIRLMKGSRLRVDITSSDFPAFDRNHNTGADYWSDAELRPARQTVFHDAARPSRLILPVMPA